MKKLIMLLFTFAAFCSVANAGESVSYKFSFTGADLMNYVIFDGADGDSAADNGIFDGARLVRNVPGYSRSYVASQNDGFETWATTTTDKLLSFNLWGLDGNGAHWGDDYKPESWGATTQPGEWDAWSSAWPTSWGTPPAGYITDEFIGWDAASFTDGLNFSDSDLADIEFSFVVNFDTDNMFWGADTNGAPNTLPTMTFWFGGAFDDDYFEAGNDYYYYEGNMVLTGQKVVPAPGAILLAGLGTACVGRIRRRMI